MNSRAGISESETVERPLMDDHPLTDVKSELPGPS